MKRIVLLILTLIVTAFAGFAQTAEKSTINIVGDAELKVLPDVVVFSVTVFAVHNVLNESVKKLNEETTSLTALLEKMGFTKEQMRIAGFSVQQEWEYENSTSVMKGYRATQHINLRFSADKDKLARLMEAFTAEGRRQFSTFYTPQLSEKVQRETEQKLIVLAMNRARENAEVIARQAGQRIVRVGEISYHTNGGSYQPQPMMERQAVAAMGMENGNGSAFQQIDLQEITLTERITITYVTEQVK
jgi:uncharacterized protein YggE